MLELLPVFPCEMMCAWKGCAQRVGGNVHTKDGLDKVSVDLNYKCAQSLHKLKRSERIR